MLKKIQDEEPMDNWFWEELLLPRNVGMTFVPYNVPFSDNLLNEIPRW